MSPPYLASGTSLDYMYIKLNVPYSYTWEVYKGTTYADTAARRRRQQQASSQLDSVDSAGTVRRPAAVPAPAAHVQKQRRLQQRPVQQRGQQQHALAPADGAAGSGAATNLLSADMQLDDCFSYFNPSDADTVVTVATQWADALVAAAEFFNQ